jgi:hypothetical protein
MPPDVIAVTADDDFKLRLEYETGEVRFFDMKPLLNMKPWNRISEPALFRRAAVSFGTVVWPGGIDIAPETLLLDSVALPSTAALG